MCALACHAAGSNSSQAGRTVIASPATRSQGVGDTAQLGELSGTFHALQYQFEVSLYEDAGEESIKGTDLSAGIARYGAGRPMVGRYELGLPDRPYAGPGRGFYATYYRSLNDTSQAYVSVAGEIEITVSSPDHIAGSFRFTGTEYSAHWGGGGRRGSGSPARIDPDAPTLQVTGSFSAVPFVFKPAP